MTWRVARSLDVLRGEVNSAHPTRPTYADGTIGDARHQAEKSDHNPLPNPSPPPDGIVTAWDITTDSFTVALAEELRLLGRGGDLRVKYVIYRGRIASRTDDWAWRPYSGFSAHFDHIHLSVSPDPAQYDRTDAWGVFQHAGGGGRIPSTSAPIAQEDDDMTPQQAQQLAEVHKMLTDLVAPRRADHKDTDPKHVSLGDVITADEQQ